MHFTQISFKRLASILFFYVPIHLFAQVNTTVQDSIVVNTPAPKNTSSTTSKTTSSSTSSGSFRIIAPSDTEWQNVKEGATVKLKFQVAGPGSEHASIYLSGANPHKISLDSLGNFLWVPSYDIADRISTEANVPIVIEAKNREGEIARETYEFIVSHVNRPPSIDELKPFYVQHRTINTYKIDPNFMRDPDGDPIEIIPIENGSIPEGMRITAGGEITWEPSLTQFNLLKKGARYIDFYVEDQPSKARTKGRLRLDITQQDLQPNITMVPTVNYMKVKENSIINLKFFLTDPNGDDDISTFEFISSNRDVPKKALVKNSATSYEFIWEPGYDFVKDPHDTLSVDLVFYVLDKAQNREEKKVRVTVQNTVNEAERDAYLFGLYRTTMAQAWNLLEQLKEREGDLKKEYRRAKKGKKNRSVVNASLGATTGLAPVLAKGQENQDLRGIITTVGGTTVATIGTLEATEVIGKSMKDLLDRFNYVMDKKSEIQNKGDIFSREYGSKAARRQADFIKKLDEYKAVLAMKGLVALELDANWESKQEATDKVIKKTFKDYTPLEDAK